MGSDHRPGDTRGLQDLYDLVPAAEEADIVEDDERERVRALAREVFGESRQVAPDDSEDLVGWLARTLGAIVIADYRID